MYYIVYVAFCHFSASMLGVSLGYGWGMLGYGFESGSKMVVP